MRGASRRAAARGLEASQEGVKHCSVCVRTDFGARVFVFVCLLMCEF